MQRFLAALGFDPSDGASLGDDVRQGGRLAFQHTSLPAVRTLDVGSDLLLLARETGGPAWPGLQTRWRTEFDLERLWTLPEGNLVASGRWEPIPGERVATSVHLNSLSDAAPWLSQPRAYAAYFGLLVTQAARRAPLMPELSAHTGPSASPLGQCRLTVRGRISHVYRVPNDLTGEAVLQFWVTAPGSWALLCAGAPGSVPGELSSGDWVEATGLLQGELVSSERF